MCNLRSAGFHLIPKVVKSLPLWICNLQCSFIINMCVEIRYEKVLRNKRAFFSESEAGLPLKVRSCELRKLKLQAKLVKAS